jgi:hypothetical protein
MRDLPTNATWERIAETSGSLAFGRTNPACSVCYTQISYAGDSDSICQSIRMWQ